MNLLDNNWIKYKGKSITYKKNKNGLHIKNSGNMVGFILLTKLFSSKSGYLNVTFNGKVISGNSIIFCILNGKRELIGETTLNSNAIIEVPKRFIVAVKVLPNTEAKVSSVNVDFKNDEFFNNFLINDLKNDTLIITPSYPTLENKYLSGFVHSRLMSYKENGIKFDVICSHEYLNACKYNFEGIDVLRVPFQQLRVILREKKYKKILVHFFDEKYASIFDATDLSDTQLYFWVHGPETLYWDWPEFTTGYFSQKNELTNDQIKQFKLNDQMIRKYNEKVHWIFVSDWIKNHSEKLIDIKFKNYSVIPNIVDDNNFNYIEKNEEQRKKIFFIRRFDDCNKYAIDVNVRTILELSRRDFFEDLEFNIYGTGDVYDKLIEPIKHFKNVHLYRKFLNHSEIAAAHKENGIGLFATRYDAQGVSMCEAAMSGLAIVTSDNEAVMEFLPDDVALISKTEKYVEYADKIEKLYKNPELFLEHSKKCHNTILKNCDYNATVKKEIDLLTKDLIVQKIKKIPAKNPVLSIIIPSYNVEKYISKTLHSLLECKNRDKLELLVVNDGSKDNTVKVVKEIMSQYNDSGHPIIKLIDKENGGHGSTINVGIKNATGKYTRIIDGDDWINSQDMDSLLIKLENENADIIVTDYSEDLAFINKIVKKNIYSFMEPGVKYNFDDLCYPNYGFNEWGPILATGNYKTEMLRDTNFSLTEKSPYVDMEFNIYSIINANSVVYYPLDIYRYFIGRSGQSVSKESFINNYKKHENILFNMLDFVNKSKLSSSKKDYIYRILINPMANSHYIILTEYMNNINEFNSFDKKLKMYSNVYYAPTVGRKFIRLHRKTRGLLLRFSNLIRLIYFKIKK